MVEKMDMPGGGWTALGFFPGTTSEDSQGYSAKERNEFGSFKEKILHQNRLEPEGG